MKKINETNAEGKEIGYWEVYDGDGKIWYKGEYDDSGNRIGTWEHYDKDGKVTKTVHTIDSKKDKL